jgi:uncharacterized damage-inducible protein DinB
MAKLTEVDTFRAAWNAEALDTLRLLQALPPEQYDFRPDPKGRSIGELAWHLCEIDGCLSFGIAHRRFSLADEPPIPRRPREVALLAPGYREVHEQAMTRIEDLRDAHLEETVEYFDGRRLTLRHVVWNELLHHLIHHRAQLVMLCRMAGGTPPGLYGPNREEMAAIQARLEPAKV